MAVAAGRPVGVWLLVVRPWENGGCSVAAYKDGRSPDPWMACRVHAGDAMSLALEIAKDKDAQRIGCILREINWQDPMARLWASDMANAAVCHYSAPAKGSNDFGRIAESGILTMIRTASEVQK